MKKRIANLLTICMTAICLTACASGSGTSGEETAEVAASSETDSAEADGNEGKAAAESSSEEEPASEKANSDIIDVTNPSIYMLEPLGNDLMNVWFNYTADGELKLDSLQNYDYGFGGYEEDFSDVAEVFTADVDGDGTNELIVRLYVYGNNFSDGAGDVHVVKVTRDGTEEIFSMGGGASGEYKYAYNTPDGRDVFATEIEDNKLYLLTGEKDGPQITTYKYLVQYDGKEPVYTAMNDSDAEPESGDQMQDGVLTINFGVEDMSICGITLDMMKTMTPEQLVEKVKETPGVLVTDKPYLELKNTDPKKYEKIHCSISDQSDQAIFRLHYDQIESSFAGARLFARQEAKYGAMIQVDFAEQPFNDAYISGTNLSRQTTREEICSLLKLDDIQRIGYSVPKEQLDRLDFHYMVDSGIQTSDGSPCPSFSVYGRADAESGIIAQYNVDEDLYSFEYVFDESDHLEWMIILVPRE
jgi:hypothetical protein